MILLDTAGRMRYLNHASEELLGGDSREFLGQPFAELFSARRRRTIERKTALCRQGKKQRYILEIAKPDSHSRWLQVTQIPRQDQAGNHQGDLLLLHDITETRLAHLAVQDQRSLAEALRDTAAALNSTLDLKEVFARILINVSKVVPHDAANIMLIEDDIARIVGSRGYEKVGLTTEQLAQLAFSVNDHHNMRVMVNTGQPIFIPDTRAYDDWVLLPETRWIQSFTAAPIKVKDTVIGFLNLDSRRKGFYNANHAMRLLAFADQAAIAIENARLYAETQRRAGFLATLNQITHTALTVSQVDEIFPAVAEAIAHFFTADYIFLVLWNQSLHQAESSVFFHTQSGRIFPTSNDLPVMQIAAQTMSEGQCLAIDKLEEVSLTLPHAAPPLVLNAIYGLPLIANQQRIGTILLGYSRTFKLKPEEIKWGEQIAAQVALAIAKVNLYAEVQRLAITDELTGLLNRRGIFEMGEREVNRARRGQLPLSIILMDLDEFKQVNDTYGHEIGDLVIQEIAHRCRKNTREIDLIGRYGGEAGDEFILILPNTNGWDAAHVANRIREVVATSPIVTPHGDIHITASLGIASLNWDTHTLQELINLADQRMYQDKHEHNMDPS